MPTTQAIEEFKAIYERRYGVALTDKDATELASNLVNLYRAVYPHEIKMADERSQTIRKVASNR